MDLTFVPFRDLNGEAGDMLEREVKALREFTGFQMSLNPKREKKEKRGYMGAPCGVSSGSDSFTADGFSW